MGKTLVIEKLISEFPELEKDINSNISEYSHVYLHLIFGDIFNPYFHMLLEKPIENQKELKKAADLLEYMSTSTEAEQEVLVTTVLERLCDDREKTAVFYHYAGNKTKQFVDGLLRCCRA